MKYSAKLKGKKCHLVLFIEGGSFRPAELLKDDTFACIPLIILRNFSEQQFFRKPFCGCFLKY